MSISSPKQIALYYCSWIIQFQKHPGSYECGWTIPESPNAEVYENRTPINHLSNLWIVIVIRIPYDHYAMLLIYWKIIWSCLYSEPIIYIFVYMYLKFYNSIVFRNQLFKDHIQGMVLLSFAAFSSVWIKYKYGTRIISYQSKHMYHSLKKC